MTDAIGSYLDATPSTSVRMPVEWSVACVAAALTSTTTTTTALTTSATT